MNSSSYVVTNPLLPNNLFYNDVSNDISMYLFYARLSKTSNLYAIYSMGPEYEIM